MCELPMILGQVYPRDWSIRQTSEILLNRKGAMKIGPFGSQLRKDMLKSIGYAVYGQENVFLNDFRIVERYISPSHFEHLRACEIHPGDFLVTMMGTIGKCAIAPEDINKGIMDSHLLRLQVNPSVFDSHFLRHLVSGSDVVARQIRRLSVGGIMEGLSSRIIGQLQYPSPEVSEQRAIAAILDTMDEAIRQTEALIAKLQKVKEGLLHDLLTRGLDEHGQLRDPFRDPEQFKDSELGRIPAGWEVTSCKDACREIVVGIVIRPTQYYVTAGVPMLRSLNVRETGIIGENLVFMNNASNALLKKSQVHTGDVVTVRTGYPGTSACIPPEYDSVNCIDLVISRPGAKIRGAFLALWINSVFGREVVLKHQGGLAQQHFNVGDLEKMKVRLPPISEQDQILGTLSSIDCRLKVETDAVFKLRVNKQGLLRDLLTGHARVLGILTE